MTDLVAEIDEEDFGFDVEKPVGAWNKQLEVDYPGVFKALLKATIGYWTGNAPATVSSAIDAAFAFKISEKPLPPAMLAWHLVRRALARAMAKLTLEALRSDRKRPTDAEGMVAALDTALDQAAVRIDRGFLDNPAGAPIVAAVKEPFRAWLKEGFGLSDAETESVAQRLGAYFVFALRREWAVHFDEYVSLNAEMRKWDTPFAKASARERSWLRNAAWLKRQIQLPVFDESFSLDQVYVDLYGHYEEEVEGERSERRSDAGPRKTRKVLVDLKKELKTWLKSPSQRDAIRVISGDPGSGKSSFAKMLAAELADDQGRRVLFVPLHLLNFTGDIQVALGNFLRNARISSHDPLDPEQGEEHLITFFDGLDELALEGHAGYQAAHRFAVQIETLVKTINLHGPRLLVVIGGRDLVVQATAFLFQNPRQILRVLPYQVTNEDFDAIVKRTAPDNFEDDRRHLWWQKYGQARGGGGPATNGMPKELAREDLLPITRQPLLNYLVALSYAREKLDFTQPITLNEIYADLLEAVYERRWGQPEIGAPEPIIRGQADKTKPRPDPGHPTVRALGWHDFVEILEEVAVLSWHGTGRTVKAGDVKATCDGLGLTAKLEAFKEGAEQGAVSLLVAFFFRQAKELGSEPSFEFTHKSFGEYLTARRLVNEIATIHRQRERNRQNRRDGKDIGTALLDWVRLAGPTAIDKDLLAFVLHEIELQSKQGAAVADWHATLVELMSDELENGMPMTMLGLEPYQEMSCQARNAEECLLAAVFACASALNAAGRNGERVHSKVVWPPEPPNLGLRDLLGRLVQGQGVSGPLGSRCLGWLAADDQLLYCADLYEANLIAANLSRANLEGANLIRANLEGANLEGADLEQADLLMANLEGANLEGANLEGANLEGANLKGANLEGAGLEQARHLRHAKIDPEWLERLGIDPKRLK